MHRLLTVPKEEGDKMNYIPHTEKSSLIRTDGKIYSVICIQYGCLFPLMQDNNQHILQKEISRTLSLSQLISLLIWHLGFTGNKLLGLPKQLSHDTESECYMRNKYLLCSLFCSSSRAMNHVAFFECVLYIFSCIFPNSSKQPLVFMYFLLFSRLAVYTKTGWCWVVRHSEDRVCIHFDHRLHHHCCVVFTCSITTIKGALHAFYEQTWWFHEGCWLETGDKKTLSHIWSLKGAVI